MMTATDRSTASNPAADGTEATPRPAGAHRVRVETLLAGRREVIIEHRDEEYRLRLTSKGKLILTK
jgi:hemin uptake protein HemP